MGNTLRNCVSPQEESEGSHQNLLRENSDSSGSSNRRHQQHGHGRARNRSPFQQGQAQRYYISPSMSRRVDELSEDEQVKIAKRLGLMGYLPIRFFTDTGQEDEKECVICMVEYSHGEELRYLPCTHRFHKACIDAWLLRSFTCPNCSQAVDSGLLGSFDPPPPPQPPPRLRLRLRLEQSEGRRPTAMVAVSPERRLRPADWLAG